jgi:hypothetical protein
MPTVSFHLLSIIFKSVFWRQSNAHVVIGLHCEVRAEFKSQRLLGDCNIKLSLCLIKYHAMKTYGGVERLFHFLILDQRETVQFYQLSCILKVPVIRNWCENIITDLWDFKYAFNDLTNIWPVAVILVEFSKHRIKLRLHPHLARTRYVAANSILSRTFLNVNSS